MGKIARSKYTDSQKKSTERHWQIAYAHQERTFRLRSNRALSYQQPEGSHGNQTRKKRPQKNILIVVPGLSQQPECSERPGDSSDGVHQSFKPERPGTTIKMFFCGRFF